MVVGWFAVCGVMIVKSTYFSKHTCSDYAAQLAQHNSSPLSFQPTALKGVTGDRYSKDAREIYMEILTKSLHFTTTTV